MAQNGLSRHIYKGQSIALYKQSGREKIGIFALNGLNVHNIADVAKITEITDPQDKSRKKRIRVKCVMNCHYFINQPSSAEYGQILGRCQSFDRDSRTIGPQDAGFVGWNGTQDKDIMDLVVDNDGNIHFGDFNSWDWMNVMFGTAPAGVEYDKANGIDINNYKYSPRFFKENTANTQSLLLKFDDGTFGLAAVTGSLSPISCVEWSKSVGAVHQSCYDSGGSTQMIANDEVIRNTGRKVPSFFMIYEDLDSPIQSLEGGSFEGIYDVEYNRSEITFPNLIVRDANGAIVGSEYYNISYKQNINAGQATIIATGVNGYTGSITQNFQILKSDISTFDVRGLTTEVVFTGENITFNNLSLEDKNHSILTEEIDYTVSYLNNRNVTNAASVIFTGQGNYQGQVIRTFKITPRNISLTQLAGYVNKVVYTGQDLVFKSLSVTDETYTLIEHQDYEISYQNNHDVTNNAHIIVTGINNYMSEKAYRFSITPQPITDNCSFENLPTLTESKYDGNDITASTLLESVIIRHDITQELLVREKDYIVLPNDPIINSGIYEIIIQGIKNYSGMTKVFNYKITPEDFSIVEIKTPSLEVVFNGAPVQLPMYLTYKGMTVAQEDYSVEYVGNDKIGDAQAIVTGQRNFIGSQTINFKVVEKSTIEISGYESSVTYTGQEIIFPNLTVSYQSELITDYTIQYYNNLHSTDNAYFEITIPTHPEVGTIKTLFRIIPVDFALGVINNASNFSKEYDGSPLTVPVINYYCNGIEYGNLKEGVDYSVGTTSSDLVNAGQKEIVITSINKDFVGTLKFTTNIYPYYFVTSAEIRNVPKEVEYTARDITFDNLEVWNTGDKLELNRDYTLHYWNNHDAYSYAGITITGIGNYRGEIFYHFEIRPYQLNEQTCFVKGIPNEILYTGEPIIFSNPEFHVETKNFRLFEGQDIDVIQYYNNTNVASDSYLMVRGINNYIGEITVHFDILPRPISKDNTALICSSPEGGMFIYDGTPQNYEAVEVITDGRRLEYQTDYIIRYRDNINATTENNRAKMEIVGLNNYTNDMVGGVTSPLIFEFDIYPASLNNNYYYVTFSENDKTYTGQPIEFSSLQVLVKDEVEKSLLEGQDYEYEYFNNVNVNDDSYVLIKGLNNYEGSFKAPFKILPYSLTNKDISYSVIEKEFEYTGSVIDVAIDNIQVKHGNKILVLDRDYTITSQQKLLNVGQYDYFIQGINNYSSSIVQKVTIVPANMNKTTFVSLKSYEYTGLPIIQEDVAIKHYSNILKENIDYTISYKENVNSGTAHIIATGRGNYFGKKEDVFVILPARFNNETVTIEPRIKSFSPIDEKWYDTSYLQIRYKGKILTTYDYLVEIETIEKENENRIYDIVTVSGVGNYYGSKTEKFMTGPLHPDTPTPQPGEVILEDRKSGYTYIQYTDSMSGLFTISAQGKSAMDELNQQLYNHAYGVESINISCVPIYHLSLNSRIFVRDEDSGINGEYIVTAISLPLSPNGMMSISAVKAVKPIY